MDDELDLVDLFEMEVLDDEEAEEGIPESIEVLSVYKDR